MEAEGKPHHGGGTTMEGEPPWKQRLELFMEAVS